MTVQNARPNAFTSLSLASEWESLFQVIGVPYCVFDVPGGPALNPTLNSGARTVVIAAGKAMIAGQIWTCDASVSTAIPAASGQDRVDLLVLRYNRSAGSAAAVVQPVVITGTPGANPSPPSISPSGSKDIRIAQWTSEPDGSLIGLQDTRRFTGSMVQPCVSAQKPSDQIPGQIAYQVDTGSAVLWNGTKWISIIAPWSAKAKSTATDVGPIPSSGDQVIHSISVTVDGQTDIEVALNWAAIYKENDSNPANSQRMVIKITIDGNTVAHVYDHIANVVSNGTFVGGGSLYFRTSSSLGTTPSAGSHTVNFTAIQDIGSANLFLKGDPTSPLTIHVAPTFA